jgi:hypothetical protein
MARHFFHQLTATFVKQFFPKKYFMLEKPPEKELALSAGTHLFLNQTTHAVHARNANTFLNVAVFHISFFCLLPKRKQVEARRL